MITGTIYTVLLALSVIFILSIIASYLFGKHFIGILRLGISLEFKTAMGIFCFLGFLALLYVGIHGEFLSIALYVISPEIFQKSILDNMHAFQKIVIPSAIFLLFSNFILLGFLNRK